MAAFLLLLLAAQTRPRPEQIRNSNQARICSNPPACVDPRAGTLVPVAQIQDGRQKLPSPPWIMDPTNPATAGDVGKPTVCVQNYIGLNLGVAADGAPLGYVQRGLVCFTQLGLAQILKDPAWAAWWAAQP